MCVCAIVELYQSVIKANQTENSERRMLKLKKLLHELPETNFETFRFLARHLAVIASNEEVNKASDLDVKLNDTNICCLLPDCVARWSEHWCLAVRLSLTCRWWQC